MNLARVRNVNSMYILCQFNENKWRKETWYIPYHFIGVPVRAINRPGGQLLGVNGRDDGPIVCFLSSLLSSNPFELHIGVYLSYIENLAISDVSFNHFILLFWQITSCIRDGVNRISLSGGDVRIFCFGVRLVKRRTLQQVLITYMHKKHSKIWSYMWSMKSPNINVQKGTKLIFWIQKERINYVGVPKKVILWKLPVVTHLR